LIAALVWSVEWQEIYSQAHKLNPTPALIAVLLLSTQYPISAWKWQQSLKLHGVDYPFGYLLRILCIAFFFNNFLPSAIGGDAYRAYRTFEHADRPAYPISAIIVERIIGIIVLVLFGYVSAIALVATAALHYKQALILASAAFGILLLLFLIAWQVGLLTKIENKFHKISKLEPLIESVRIMRANRRHFWSLVGMSVLFQGVAICSIAFLFSALALPGRIFESGFTAAAAGVAGVIPLSINGIGIVEGSFAIAAVLASLPYVQSVIVALFLRVFGLAASILFGILYLFERSDGNTSNEEKSA
jgi:glycosyltransferase 2 family protein